MPELLEDPGTEVLNIAVSTATAQTVAVVARLVDATTLDFSARLVLGNAKRCLEAALAALPIAQTVMIDACQSIDAALKELSSNQLASPALASGFLPADRPALRLLSHLPQQASPELLQSIGNLFISSRLTDTPLPRERCKRLTALSKAHAQQPQLSSEQSSALDTLLKRSKKDLLETLAQHQYTKDKKVLRFNSQLLNHLRADLSSSHPDRQRDANPRRFLEGIALSQAIAKTAKDMESGDPRALVTLLGFSLNLHLDLLRQVPLRAGDECQGHVFWIDPLAGVAHLDTQLLLRELGKPIPGCETSRSTMRLPLPTRVSDQLKLAAIMRPSARTVGDLSNEGQPIQDRLATVKADSFRAKLMRSAPSCAIRWPANRAVAAYGFLAFHLIDESDLPYISVYEAQIWSIRREVFKSIGLGELADVETIQAGHIGSARTASGETVRHIFSQLDAAVEAIRVGNQYSLQTVIEHHNLYALRVATYLHFVSGSRASQDCSIFASSWFADAIFGFIDDKDVGLSGGRTPIPISPTTALQLELWASHLVSLKGRLQKKLGTKAIAASALIDKILQRMDVPLFFSLDENGLPQPIRTEQLFKGGATDLNRDWGRHFFSSGMVEKNRPLTDMHVFLRHQGGALNPHSATGINVQFDLLQRGAVAIESILNDLGIRALPGLVGGKK